MQLRQVLQHFSQNISNTLEVTDDVDAIPVKQGYNLAFEARPLKRLIQKSF